MAYTDVGIYYPDDNTSLSIAQITQNIAESIDSSLGITKVSFGKTSTLVENNSLTVFANSGLTASIQPNSVDSKIIVIVNMPMEVNVGAPSSNYWTQADFNLLRNNTIISRYSSGFYGILGGGSKKVSQALNIYYVDSPNSTSLQTYTIQGKVANNTPTPASQSLKMNYSLGAVVSNIVLIEVAS